MAPSSIRSAPLLAASATGFRASVEADLAAARQEMEKILSVSGPRTLENTLEPINEIEVRMQGVQMLSYLATHLHPDLEIRAAGDDVVPQLAALRSELWQSRDLFEAVNAVDASALDVQAARFHRHILRDFRRSGVHRDAATREQLAALSKREAELAQQFLNNIRNDVRSLSFPRQRLAGLPEDHLARLPRDSSGQVTISTIHDWPSVATYVEDPSVRCEVFQMTANCAWPQNEAVLLELLTVRGQIAHLLGFQDAADFSTEPMMAGSGGRVAQFLDEVEQATSAGAQQLFNRLLERKRKDDPRADTVHVWELKYYLHLVQGESYQFDARELRCYLDGARALQGLLALTSRLFGIEYTPVSESPRWHEEVLVYDVTCDAKKLGRVYLDLHPREGKLRGGRMIPLAPSAPGRQLPEVALSLNVPRGLLDPDHLVVMFHEFGHTVHALLGSEQRWARFWGVACERDFCEMPSMLFEAWAQDADALRLFATHCDTGQPIPAELVQRWRLSAAAERVAEVRWQLRNSAAALLYHRLDAVTIDTTAVWADCQNRYAVCGYMEGTHWHASMPHLSGMAAAYYTYLWSQVIARDVISEFSKHGMLDEATGRRYRDAILVHGGTRDGADMVREFLGRDFSFEPFRLWATEADRQPRSELASV